MICIINKYHPLICKLVLFFMLVVFINSAMGQVNENEYPTDVDDTNNIKDNEVDTSILKPDSLFIGKVIINRDFKSDVHFVRSISTPDSSGIYRTVYKFVSKDHAASFNVQLAIDFDKPILSRGPNGFIYGSSGMGVFSGTYGIKSGNMGVYIKGLATGEDFYIIVNSTDRVYATIYE
jgi:hypothetical protein